MEINIREAALELQRLKYGEDNTEGLPVPGWCFRGDIDTDERIENEGMINGLETGYMPVMPINAVDGSAIDFDMGY